MGEVRTLLLSTEGVILLEHGVRKHPLLGVLEHPAFPNILSALLPDGHHLVKIIGVWIEEGRGLAAHQHPETTTLWYPKGAQTPLVIHDALGDPAEEIIPVDGQVVTLAPGTVHSVPFVIDKPGRLAVAVLSVGAD